MGPNRSAPSCSLAVGHLTETKNSCSLRDAPQIDFHAGSLGRRKGQFLDECSLLSLRSRFQYRVHECLHVAGKLILGEACLADSGLEDAGLLDPKLDGAAFG